MNKLGKIAISQIIILVVGIIAIGYAIGDGFEEVSADDPSPGEEDTGAETSPSDEKVILLPFLQKKLNDPNIVINPSVAGNAGEKIIEESSKIFTHPDYKDTMFRKVDGVLEASIDEGKTWLSGSELGEEVISKVGTGRITKVAMGIWASAKAIVTNAVVALTIYTAVKSIGPILGLNADQADAAAKASFLGYMAGKTTIDLFKEGGLLGDKFGRIGDFLGKGWGGLVVGGVVALYVFYKSYKKTDEIRIQYTCQAWDAPTGGKYCEECNKGNLPCTEYMCKSLGQACELINSGTEDQMCSWKDRNDVNPPEIRPWEDALLDKDYSYKPTKVTHPRDRGVFIEYKKGCIPAFTPFTFGITLNEPAKCKVDVERKETFEEMAQFFGASSLLKYNHTQSISLPGPESLEAENITLKNNGKFELYVKCQDMNGNPKDNSPSGSFVFKYCVDEGPDTTPPLIVGINHINNTPIGFNQSSIDIELYVNEPAECRWTHDKDTSFENMEGTMNCPTSVFEMNAQMLYKCSTTLTGIKNRQENKFYFRCKDKPLGVAENDRNVNSKGYVFVLIGTQPLVIDSVGPVGKIKDSTDVVKVTLEAETSAGYKEGEATCYYSESCYKESGSKTDYSSGAMGDELFKSHIHSEDIWVNPGNYECSIKCIDLGGNSDTKEFEFEVEIDNSAPVVVRAYHEGGYLKIITNEEAGCVYSNTNCNYLFEPDGILMQVIDKTEHYVDWDAQKTYYIKCQDKYGRQPFPNACSIIVRPVGNYNG